MKLDQLEQRGLRAILGTLDCRDQKGILDHKVSQDRWGHKGHKGHKEYRVKPDQPEQRGLRAIPGPLGTLDYRDHKVKPDHKASQGR